MTRPPLFIVLLIWLACCFVLLTPDPARCDQAQLLTCDQAEAARQRLGSVIRQYCPPCDDVAFALSPRMLTFYFSPYHVGPYAGGEYTVSVPYTKVIDLIGDDSPLQGLSTLTADSNRAP